MRVLISGEKATDRDLGRRAALRTGLDCTAADCVPLDDLGLRLSREPEVHLVLVCLDPEPTAAIQAIQAAAEHFEQPIYAVTSGDVTSIRKPVQQAGAVEVWTMNDVREGLVRSTEDLHRNGNPSNRRGRMIAVTGSLPGSGVTTVATGLAFGFGGKANVVLAELGAGVPELALDLDITPRHSLAELIQATNRMDSSMIRDTVVQHPMGVDVLAYLPDSLTAIPLDADGARDFQILLRNLYDWVVVDAGHPHGEGPHPLVHQADQVVVVTRLDPPALRLTRKFLQVLTTHGLPANNIAVVANRYGQSGLVPWKKAQEALKTTIRAWIPDDPRSVNRSLVEGRPLAQTARRSALVREFASLARELDSQLRAAK
jgi:pilus assembly protein CpaE